MQQMQGNYPESNLMGAAQEFAGQEQFASPKKSGKMYPALNMRNPGGASIVELQQKDRAGQIMTNQERVSLIPVSLTDSNKKSILG